ncbi:MAG: hypothetical protein R2875_02275 [Desulfobacterales bacterium]
MKSGAGPKKTAAAFIKKGHQAVVGFVAGLTAPRAGAWAMRAPLSAAGSGTTTAKIAALKDAGVHVCENLGYIGEICADVFS